MSKATLQNFRLRSVWGSDQVAVQGTPTIAPTVNNVTALSVYGTAGNDQIIVNPGSSAGDVSVRLNGTPLGTYRPQTLLIIFGLTGNDDIQVAGSVSIPVELHGDAGDDRLKGGDGNDILLGGDGDDLIAGGSGRDILIGGLGADRIVGDAEDDILIAGVTEFDTHSEALALILAASNRDYGKRVANLKGTGSGQTFADRLNGNLFLKTAGSDATVFDDTAADILTGSAGQDWFVFNADGPGVRDRQLTLRPANSSAISILVLFKGCDTLAAGIALAT